MRQPFFSRFFHRVNGVCLSTCINILSRDNNVNAFSSFFLLLFFSSIYDMLTLFNFKKQKTGLSNDRFICHEFNAKSFRALVRNPDQPFPDEEINQTT